MAVTLKTTKEYYAPKNHIHRDGCPSITTPYCKITTSSSDKRVKDIVHKYTTMQLSHRNAEGELKNALPLGKIHHELEVNSLIVQGSGSSNILLSKVSFDCLITRENGEEVRDYLSFDLRIPGANSEEEGVFSYEMIEEAYGGKENLYAALEHFYSVGRAKANAEGHKHGHEPEYDASSSKHDQYIRHTEQLLVAYLATPKGATMLSNRLRIELRGKYPDVSSVKVYNMGLHMHSTKTCCAPCEYSLIGLMNDRRGFMQDKKRIGFLPNFARIASKENERLEFTFPSNSLFRLLVTVSTSETDAHHQKEDSYSEKKLRRKETAPAYEIDVKARHSSRHIFTTMFKVAYDQRRLTDSSNFSDITVGISGSKATSGSPGTIDKVQTTRQGEGRLIGKQLRLFKV